MISFQEKFSKKKQPTNKRHLQWRCSPDMVFTVCEESVLILYAPVDVPMLVIPAAHVHLTWNLTTAKVETRNVVVDGANVSEVDILLG